MSVFVIPSNRQIPLDPKTGAFERSWYLFFQAVFDRIGGAGGTGNAVIDAALEDIRANLATLPDGVAQADAIQKAFAAYQVTQAAVDAAQTNRIADLEVWEAFR